MKKSITKAPIIFIIAILMAFMPFGVSVYASDTYINFGALSANEVNGVDYKIESKDIGSNAIIMAIHGGKIEKGTTELAKAISDLGSYNYYSFIGIKSSDNFSLHITSSNFDEKLARDMAAKSKFTVSIHGAAGTDKVTYLGGLDTALGKQIQKSLVAAGFVVKPAPEGLNGTDVQNIANSNLSGKGVQIEITRGLRDAFLTSAGAPSATLAKYAAAVNKGIKTYIAVKK
jgi:phage replication-related protein YjqB (UPF0714/DUF867 family)